MAFLLPALAGILLFASFPRADQGYLAWIAFIPLAAFISLSRSVRRTFAGGFIAGFIQLFALLTWMPAVLAHYGGLSHSLAWVAYTLLISLLACYPAAACGLSKYLIRTGGDSFILVFPAIWVLLEYAQSFSPFGGLPWLMAGYSQSRFLSLIQIADLTGVYGISFVLVWTGTSIFWFLRNRGRGLAARIPLIAAAAMIASCFIYGSLSLKKWEIVTPQFRAAMLQGNLSFDEPASVLLDKFQNGYVRMADRLKPSRTDLLLLPESPTPVYFETNSGYRMGLEKLAGRFNLGIIFNNVRYVENLGESRYFNSAYFVDRNGVLRGVYDKMHLVPFGEYIPLKKIFSFIEVISKDVGSFEPGNEYRIIRLGDHPANAIICFEAVFPNLVRRFVQGGSELIVNLTNDGWYGDTAAPYQHLAIARFRAVENRRFLLRATNSGISAVVEPTGKLQSSTGILREAICEGGFGFVSFRTFYTRYGDVFVFLCAIISCGSALLAVFHRGVTRKRSA